MILGEPGRTNYDIEFSFLGFPVRIHPAFFILPVFLGASFISGGSQEDQAVNTGLAIIVTVILVFLSILVHELGHALAYRYYGKPARIVLYWMGGLAIADGDSWMSARRAALAPNQQVVISLAGPIAGLLLAAVFAAIVVALGGTLIPYMNGIVPMVYPLLLGTALETNQGAQLFFECGLFINIFWNVMNLAPVFPLDGGQVARQVWIKMDAWTGIQKSLWASVIVGAVIAVGAMLSGDRFIGILFAVLAISNYMTLQQSGGGFRRW